MRISIIIFLLVVHLGWQTKEKKPTDTFIEFTNSMKNEGWLDDHERLLEVSIYSEIDREAVEIFDKSMFYSVPYEDSRINRMDISRYFNSKDYKQSLSSVRAIWAYFYRKEPRQSFNTDGVIEEWEFENDTSAFNAINELEKVAQTIYFNTTPYFFQKGKYVYIFHTRAMAFSIDQKRIYEQFKSMALDY